MRLLSSNPAARPESISALRRALVVAALLLPLGRPAAAQDISIHANAPDSSAWIVRRLPLQASDAVLHTRGRDAVILLCDTTLVVQLTDRGLDELRHGPDSAEHEGLGARILARMIVAGLGELMDHGIAYKLSALREARADGHRLILEDRAGHRVFDRMELNGREMMDDFPSGTAQWFAARINEAIRRQH